MATYIPPMRICGIEMNPGPLSVLRDSIAGLPNLSYSPFKLDQGTCLDVSQTSARPNHQIEPVLLQWDHSKLRRNISVRLGYR